MARIHENTIKWLNEQIKKKYIKSKSSNVALDEDLKQCIYCHKLFVNASFVMKHILKRHAEQFLHFYKKSIDSSKVENSINPEIDFISYLKSEFSNIKSEIAEVKKAVIHPFPLKDQIENSTVYPTSCPEIKYSSDIFNFKSQESHLQQGDMVHNVTKKDFYKLQSQVKEVTDMYQETVSSTKEMSISQEDRICRRLKEELFTDFEKLFIHYQDQNSEWKPHLFQLKNDFKKLEQTVEMNTRQIRSPEILKEVENKIEQQIKNFYDNYGITEGKCRISSKRNKRALNENSHRVNRRKKSIYTSSSMDTNVLKPFISEPVKVNETQYRRNISEIKNVSPSSILKGGPDCFPKLDIAKVLFEEKLKAININPKIEHISNDEYEIKMHLVDAQKELLYRRYKGFQQLYSDLDVHANKLVKSQMEKKVRKQLRFSDAVPSGDLKSKEFPCATEKCFLPHEEQTSNIDETELLQELGACGELPKVQNCEEDITAYIERMSTGDFAPEAKEEDTKQSVDVLSCRKLLIAELKSVQSSKKVASPKPFIDCKTVDEFSELSSLESD